ADGSTLISIPGAVLAGEAAALTWNNDNDNGQMLTGGTYSIKVGITDPFGKVSSISSSITVIRPESSTLVLYNSAGEAVRHFDLAAMGVQARGLGEASAHGIELKTALGGPYLLAFDAKNDAGEPLKGGIYELVFASESGDGKSV